MCRIFSGGSRTPLSARGQRWRRARGRCGGCHCRTRTAGASGLMAPAAGRGAVELAGPPGPRLAPWHDYVRIRRSVSCSCDRPQGVYRCSSQHAPFSASIPRVGAQRVHQSQRSIDRETLRGPLRLDRYAAASDGGCARPCAGRSEADARSQMAEQYARVRHATGTGSSPGEGVDALPRVGKPDGEGASVAMAPTRRRTGRRRHRKAGAGRPPASTRLRQNSLPVGLQAAQDQWVGTCMDGGQSASLDGPGPATSLCARVRPYCWPGCDANSCPAVRAADVNLRQSARPYLVG